MAMTFWEWEELPDDILMKDKAYYTMMEWVIKNKQFTRKEFMDACDVSVNAVMGMSDIGLFAKQLAEGLLENKAGHLSRQGDIYFIASQASKYNILSRDDLLEMEEGGVGEYDGPDPDHKIVAIIEDERKQFHKEFEEYLDEEEYWD